jgi:predicted nucleic acid-binding protein
VSETQFIDTNIFLRYLTQDEQHYKACLALFQRAERNQVNLITSEVVIVETVFVLSSPQHYRLTRQQIHVTLSRLLLLPGLKLLNRNIHLRALALYAHHALDFEDCLSIAYMEQLNVPQIYSYDRGFDHINTVQRVEPELAPVERGEVLQSEALPSKPPNHDE